MVSLNHICIQTNLNVFLQETKHQQYHLSETQYNYLPGNLQPPHRSKNDKVQQKTRDRTLNHQRQDQYSASSLANIPNTDANV